MQSAAAMWVIVKKQVIRIKLAAARDDSTDERHKGWVCRPADRQVRYACCNRCDFPAAKIDVGPSGPAYLMGLGTQNVILIIFEVRAGKSIA